MANTFAYLLAACSQQECVHEDIQEEFSRGNSSGIIEMCVCLEAQYDSVNCLWPSDWEVSMSRLAPVQMTQSWDCRPYLLRLFEHCGIYPTYQRDFANFLDPPTEEQLGHIIFFAEMPTKDVLSHAAQSTNATVINPKDKDRFDKVLAATIDLARQEERGVLFIGHWGWDYQKDEEHLQYPEVQSALSLSGMKFLTRHAN